MKSRTIASEITPIFYVRLKRSRMIKWYVSKLVPGADKHFIKRPQLMKSDLKINQIAFFNKHVWYHFTNLNNYGWIPLKFVRKNYRRLDVTPWSGSASNYLVVLFMLCHYQNRALTSHRFVNFVRTKPLIQLKRPDDFSRVVTQLIGHFKNLSRKSSRRLRSQLLRCRPVVLWVHPIKFRQTILLVGFNRRLFFYFDPVTKGFGSITRKQLLKIWRQADYLAYSC